MAKFSEFQKHFSFDKYTGFGSAANNQGDRLLSKDGNFNVKREGQSFFERLSPYHQLIRMSWGNFLLLIIAFFILVNLLFSMSYYLVGLNQLAGILSKDPVSEFIEVNAFSAQTLTTVGYGRINPIGLGSDILTSFESLFGLLSFAFITGLLYGRFSRPFARLLYSENAIIAPFQNKTALMFRIANGRKNQLIECETTLLFNYLDKESNMRRFINLTLEYNKVNALSLSWTVVHPINEDSPLNGLSKIDLEEMKAEVIVLFKAFDDTYSQVVHTRHSYTAPELVWGAKFNPMFNRSNDGKATVLDLKKIGEFSMAELPN
jgi:inward rectifier potassium channel